MEIKNSFYLQGFTRIDKGESGAVFVRYEAETNESGEPEVFDEGQRFHRGKAGESFCIWLPAPKVRKVSACAIVTRTSKNSYTAACYDERQIATLKSDTLEGLRHTVAEFFKEASA